MNLENIVDDLTCELKALTEKCESLESELEHMAEIAEDREIALERFQSKADKFDAFVEAYLEAGTILFNHMGMSMPGVSGNAHDGDYGSGYAGSADRE